MEKPGLKKGRIFVFLILIPLLILWGILTFIFSQSEGDVFRLEKIDIIGHEVKFTAQPVRFANGELEILLSVESYEQADFLKEDFSDLSILLLDDESPLLPASFTMVSEEDYRITGRLLFRLESDTRQFRLQVFGEDVVEFLWQYPLAVKGTH